MKRIQSAPTDGGGMDFGMNADEYLRMMRLHGWDYCEHENIRRFCPQCNPEGARDTQSFPAVVGLENALKLWRGGFDSWRNVPRAEHRAEYERVILAIKERLNDCPDIAALVNRYYEANDWCLNIAKRLYPEKPSMWRLSIVEDAAYWLRLMNLTNEGQA